MKLTAYDLYCYLDAAIEFYLDSIAIKEDPTDEERTRYEYIKYWRPSKPDVEVENILKSLAFTNKEENGTEK
jgi:hypothetical protein